MNKPEFPYKGNQVIISSGRTLLHAKDDFVFIFGKKGVGISTPYTCNIDAPEATLIYSNLIELGVRAKYEGEPVLKGETTLKQLNRLFNDLSKLGDALSKLSVENVAAIAAIKLYGGAVRDTAKSVKNQLNAKAKSNVTYTK